MLLEFTVGKYRSFFDKKTLSMKAQKISEPGNDNVVVENSYRVLKTLAIYGANSSGKSNLVRALNTMIACVLSSVKLNDGDSLLYDPFLLLQGNQAPTFFEIVFMLDNSCYRYGFCYSHFNIEEEWLFVKGTPRSKESPLYIRNNDGIAINEKLFAEGEGGEKILNDNRLFLSLCAQLGGSVSKKVLSWFQSKISVISGINNQNYRTFSELQFHKKTDISIKALDFLKKLQLGFVRLETKEENLTFPDDFPDELKAKLSKELEGKKQLNLNSIHHVYSRQGIEKGVQDFSFYERESSGTIKLFDLAGPLFETLDSGSVLVIDELDAKMHPLISQHIIDLFNDIATNPNHAQLIFTTHDTHLLSTKNMRRDQIWFTEKNAAEQTDLYCLTDIVLPDGTKPRNNANYERNYIAGRYGAIPFILNE